MPQRVLILFLCWMVISCTASRTPKGQRSAKIEQEFQIRKEPDDLLLEKLMRSRPDLFDGILRNRAAYRVQIMYTQIDHPANRAPQFQHYIFQLNAGEYFYPASTVKLPVALLALEAINRWKQQGVSRESMFVLDANPVTGSAVYNDPQATDGVPRLSNWLKDIFLVSDNEAFNHLYDWLGADAINQALQQKVFNGIRILHRLGMPPVVLPDGRDQTSAWRIYNEGGTEIIHQKSHTYRLPPVNGNIAIGKGYYRGDSLLPEPMNFAAKNAATLSDLHQSLIRLIYPSAAKAKEQWKIDPADRRWLLELMRAAPRFSARNTGLRDTYGDAYTKYLYYGGTGGPLNQPLEMYNKSGMAYGFLTDIAYFADRTRNIDFFLSATIYVNSDEILNDDHYDYETIGLPFLKNLGQLIYEYEQKRPRSSNADWQQLLPGWEK